MTTKEKISQYKECNHFVETGNPLRRARKEETHWITYQIDAAQVCKGCFEGFSELKSGQTSTREG